MSDRIEPWSIKQISEDLQQSFAVCTCDFERGMWRVYAGKDCKRILNGRKPTPGEQSILDHYQIRVDL